jgi:Flp pilus assembly protein CpaB
MQTTTRRPSEDGKGPGSAKARPSLTKGKGPLSSKNGAVGAAIVTAVLAGLVIVVFLQQYRSNVNSDGVPTSILVAKSLIERGASGDVIGAQGLVRETKLPRDQLKDGAITDAGVLLGQVAKTDILPGQQLTRADFKNAGRGIVTKLGADERAISISLDSAHGLIGPVRTGDHVDVLSGFMVENGVGGRTRPFLRTMMQDVLVLDAPKKDSGGGVGGGNQTKQITLRVSDVDAPKLAFAADNGKVWIVLRPQNGESVDRRPLVTLESLLFDTKPVRVQGR